MSDEPVAFPLHAAAIEGNLEAAAAALGGAHPIDAKDDRGRVALQWASRFGHCEVVSLLIDRGAKLETRSDSAMTALHLACLYGHRAAAVALLDRGAQIEAMDSYGLTPLHHACRGGHIELALFLIFPRGANAKSRSKAKRTCYHDLSPETRALVLAQAKRMDDL